MVVHVSLSSVKAWNELLEEGQKCKTKAGLKKKKKISSIGSDELKHLYI